MGSLHLHQIFSYVVTASVLLVGHCEAESSVPFITWANHQYLKDIPSKSVGQIVDTDFLLSTCVQTIMENKHNQLVIVFYFNQLSIDDISKYGSAYSQNSNGGKLENFMQSYESSASHLAMEMVEPVLLKDIKGKATGPIIEYDEEWSSKLIQDQVNLLVVPLQVSSDRVSSFGEADDVIKKVMDEALNMGMKFTAILTAHSSSKLLSSSREETIVQVGRQLLQQNESSDNTNQSYSLIKFMTNNCSGLVYFAQIIVEASEKTYNTSNTVKWETDVSTCTNHSASLVMKQETTNLNFTLRLNFKVTHAGYFWTFGESVATFTSEDEQEKENSITFSMDETRTPLNFSYHCGNKAFKNATAGTNIILVNFQVQPFNVNRTAAKFGRANDCVGFLTPGIWMGLMTTLILVLILYFGVSMLASLTVMDQFDDPKGKTITVNVAE